MTKYIDKIFELKIFQYLLKINIGYRLMILVILPAIPIGWDTYVAIRQNISDYSNISTRLKGIGYILHLDQLLRNTQLRRDYSTAMILSGKTDDLDKQIRSSENNIRAIIKNIDNLEAELQSNDLKTSQQWVSIRKDLLTALNTQYSDESVNFSVYSKRIVEIRNLIKTIVIEAGIFLDSSGSTYYMLIAGLENLPDLADHYGQIGHLAGKIQRKGSVTQSDVEELARLKTGKLIILSRLEENIAAISNLNPVYGSVIRPVYEKLKTSLMDYNTQIERIIRTGQVENKENLYVQGTKMMEPLYGIQSIITDLSRHLLQEQENNIYLTMRTLFIISGIIGLLALGFALMIALSINKPIQSAIELTEAMATGNFTKKARIHGDDEMAHFLSTINAMSTNLSQMIIGIYDTAKQTAESAVELSAASQDFSRTADQQADAVQHASSAIEQITASTEEIGGSMQSSANSMEEINGNLKHLSQIAEQVKNTMQQLNVLSKNTSEKASGSDVQISLATSAMNKIEESTNKITEFTTIITGISDQTNLLSLNASIEAARAGDAGRGFAVVAEEISKLADQTINSVKEVKLLIDESMAAVRNGSTQVKLVADNLKNIINDIQKIGTHTDYVMEMFKQQSDNTVRISHSSDAMNSVFSQIISSVSEQKRASGDIERTMSDLANGAQSVSDNARQLSDLATNLKSWSEYMLKMVDVFQIE